jgi:hypothetical protein
MQDVLPWWKFILHYWWILHYPIRDSILQVGKLDLSQPVAPPQFHTTGANWLISRKTSSSPWPHLPSY